MAPSTPGDGKDDEKKQMRVAFNRLVRGVTVLLILMVISFALFASLFSFFSNLVAPFLTSLPAAKAQPQPVSYSSEGDKFKGKIAFMFLTRGPLPLAPLWEKFFKVSCEVHVGTTEEFAEGVVTQMKKRKAVNFCASGCSVQEILQLVLCV